jgi:hypothetical protein
MSQASKAKAAKKREHQKRQKELDMASLNRKWDAFLKQEGGFARSPKHKDAPKELSRADKAPFRRNFPDEVRQGRYTIHVAKKQDQQLSEEMQAREEIARRDYDERIRTRIGQVYPKGSDQQYLTDSDLRDMKGGLLRRRS